MTPNKLDALSGPIIAAAGTVASTEPFGPLYSKIAAGLLALLAVVIARLTPHVPTPKV